MINDENPMVVTWKVFLNDHRLLSRDQIFGCPAYRVVVLKPGRNKLAFAKMRWLQRHRITD